MRVTVKTGLICAAIWIGIKSLFFFMGWNTKEMLPVLVMLNILGVLLSIAIGLYLQKMRDTEGSNALRDIKNAMAAGVPYTIIVSIFMLLYYSKIDPEFNKKQIAEAEVAILKSLDSPEELKAMKESNPSFEVMTKEEIYEDLRKAPQTWYSAKFTMTVGLLAMLLLSTINSIVVTVIYRKIMFRKIEEARNLNSAS